MNGNSHHIGTDYTAASEAEGARHIIRNIDKQKKWLLVQYRSDPT